MTEQNTMMKALEVFEAAEANLSKLERLWDEIVKLTPSGVAFGTPPEYEDRCRSYSQLLSALPKINGWKPTAEPEDIDAIGQMRFDAMELYEPSAQISVERAIEEPGRELREYRFRLNSQRRQLVREALIGLIDAIDVDLRALHTLAEGKSGQEDIPSEHWADFREHCQQIEVLLGSGTKPARWQELRRHLGWGQACDLHDIERTDWPTVKANLRKDLYGANEPIPVSVDDLSDIVNAKPKGKVITQLQWANLRDEDFERLIFSLITGEKGYENPEWMTQTRAADRGRDLSVFRVVNDPLSGTSRFRIILQCKHWQSRSVNQAEISVVKDQMLVWNDPPVDELIIVTSGRFTTDALAWVEQHNGKRTAPKIALWAESHLESLLAERPGLIAEFNLRKER